MRIKLLIIGLVQILSFSGLQTFGQPRQFTYNFVITGRDGEPIKNALLKAAGSPEGYTDERGMISYRVPYGYVTISAPGYKKRTHVTMGINYGSTIPVSLAALPPERRNIKVYVKDKYGKPVSGAQVLVAPGTSNTTNSQGYADASHTQIIGEYVTLTVSAAGFKTQQQRILTGENRKGTGEFGAVKTPDDVATFILQPGNAPITSLVVEVLDSKSNKPVAAAAVAVNIINGEDVGSGTTSVRGEVLFSDFEASGEMRVKVRHSGYKDKWSDIPLELLESPTGDRRFLVYLDPEAKEARKGDWTLVSATVTPEDPNATWKDHTWSYTAKSTSAHYSIYNGDYKIDYNWNPPPSSFGLNGFSVSFGFSGTAVRNQTISGVIGVSASGLSSDTKDDQLNRSVNAAGNGSISAQKSVNFKPLPSSSDIVVKFGMGWAVTYTYKYHRL